VNNEMEIMWQEVVMAKLKLLFRHFPVGAEEIPKNFSGQSVSRPTLEPGSSQIQVGGVKVNQLLRSHNRLHGAEPFLRSHQLRSHSRISKHFMEPEGS
jgi:hypothetical protein